MRSSCLSLVVSVVTNKAVNRPTKHVDDTCVVANNNAVLPSDLFQFYIEAGIMLMKPGDAVCDWVHVNNLVQAHILTIPAFSSSSNCIAVSTRLHA